MKLKQLADGVVTQVLADKAGCDTALADLADVRIQQATGLIRAAALEDFRALVSEGLAPRPAPKKSEAKK